MAKYYYERYDIDWDTTGITNAVRMGSYTYNLVKKDGSDGGNMDVASLPIGSMSVRSADAVSFFYQGNTRNVYYKYTATGARVTSMQKSSLLNRRVKGSLIDTITAEDGTYPDNGISGEYWYIKGAKAIPTIRYGGQEIQGIKYKNGSGQVIEVSDGKYKDSTGTVKGLH